MSSHFRPATMRAARLVWALAFASACGAAQANEYADVNQLMRNGRWADAALRADAYLASNPRDPQMRLLQATIQSQAGRADQALATLTLLTEQYPELAEPHNDLAVLQAARGDLKAARSSLDAALRANPRLAVAHENLGDLFAREAVDAYARAASARPGVAAKRALASELSGAAVAR